MFPQNVTFAHRSTVAAQGYGFQVRLACCATQMFSSARTLGPAWCWVLVGGMCLLFVDQQHSLGVGGFGFLGEGAMCLLFIDQQHGLGLGGFGFLGAGAMNLV